MSRVAQIAGVTVRTLHHYDDIGLLRPSGRTSGGYRRYDEQDLERLRLILVYRELGFTLEEIRTILATANPGAHLRRQHGLLLDRIERLRQMVTAIEMLLEAHTMGISLSPEEKFEVFGDFDPEAHEPEVRDRWGDSDAYAQSARRVGGYTKDDWLRIQGEAADLLHRFIAVMDSGEPPTSPAAMALAEEHREHITEHFYDCGYEIHIGLAELYVTDDRFRRYYDQHRPGLAQYVHDAIEANAVTRA